MKKFKLRRQPGLFDTDLRLTKLSTLGDPLEILSQNIDFELFRPVIENRIENKSIKGKGGRPPYDYVMMFKILVLQRVFNLSDAQAEFQINDRLSFMRFLGLSEADDVPDEKTIWKFKEQLSDIKLVEELFDFFLTELADLGMELKSGRVVDASVVGAPVQRNKKEDNEKIKEGERPAHFDQNPNVGRQKDTDARFTKKRNTTFFGYKNHVKIDLLTKLILRFCASPANMHDSQALERLMDTEEDQGQDLYADSAYSGEPCQETAESVGAVPQVCEKGYRGKPLTEAQKEANTEKCKKRARVEHVFGDMAMRLRGQALRCIGLRRAETHVGMLNLCYNLMRLCTLCAQGKTPKFMKA